MWVTPRFFDAGSLDASRCRTTPPRLGFSRAATAATAWIIALSRSSDIRGSSSRRVSVAMVRRAARSSPKENGSSRPGAAEPSGSTRALRPRACSTSTSGSASPLGSITATVTPRSASCMISSSARVVLPPPGSPVTATAVGRLSTAASSGSKCTMDRARPMVSPM